MKFMEKLKKAKKDNKGFSLVELIIVIAIMAILVGIVGTQVIPYINKSKEAKDLQIISSYSTAAMTAYASYAEKVDADISFNVYDTTLTDVSKDMADEIQRLTYSAIPNLSSTKGGSVTKIIISIEGYGTADAKIVTKATSDDETNVLFEVESKL